MDIFDNIESLKLENSVALPSAPSETVTLGDYRNEDESKTQFDLLAESSGLFRVYKEVSGFYVQPKFLCELKSCFKADRILIPTNKLIDAGWRHGPIGVECKTSGYKISQVLPQVCDYTRSIFRLPNGANIMPEWWFIWPWKYGSGTVAAMCQHFRIGGCCSTPWIKLGFYTDNRRAIEFNENGTVKAAMLVAGRKTGSK